MKSANEIEEEMLAKMPKFKARPLPKKVQILNTSLFWLRCTWNYLVHAKISPEVSVADIGGTFTSYAHKIDPADSRV